MKDLAPLILTSHERMEDAYIYDMYAGGRLILDTLDDMYKSMKIEDFMKNSYEYSKEHEEEIWRHIKVSES